MVIFTNHAILKLNQRNISKKLVEATIKLPDYELSSYSNRKVSYKKFGKLYLKVVYRKGGGNIIIITQYWDKNFKSNNS